MQEKYGFHVTNLNIAKVKQKHGINERENYNEAKSENSRQPGTFVSVGLAAAEGKEGFYKIFGFDLNRGMGKYFEYKQR